jgi:hypothetical protein
MEASLLSTRFVSLILSSRGSLVFQVEAAKTL